MRFVVFLSLTHPLNFRLELRPKRIVKLNPPLAIKVLNASSEPCGLPTSGSISINACCRILVRFELYHFLAQKLRYLVLNSFIALVGFQQKAMLWYV